MANRLFLAMSVGLFGFAQISNAADAKWIAISTLESGSTQCGVGQSEWQFDIAGATLKLLNMSANRSYIVDLKDLQPDGSGKVTAKGDTNREFYLTFQPGSGPRIVRVALSTSPCNFLMTPKK
jgi:hypothetical protein